MDELEALRQRIAALEADVAAIKAVHVVKINLGLQKPAETKAVRPQSDKAVRAREDK